MQDRNSLMVLIAGPYRSGTGDDPDKLAANVDAMNRVALDVFRAGHTPITGEAMALPLVELAGSHEVGDAAQGRAPAADPRGAGLERPRGGGGARGASGRVGLHGAAGPRRAGRRGPASARARRRVGPLAGCGHVRGP